MTPAIPGRTAWQVGSAITLGGKLGLLSEQIRRTCPCIPGLVPTVVQTVRPFFPERLIRTTGFLYSCVIALRQVSVECRVGIGHRKVTPKLLPYLTSELLALWKETINAFPQAGPWCPRLLGSRKAVVVNRARLFRPTRLIIVFR